MQHQFIHWHHRPHDMVQTPFRQQTVGIQTQGKVAWHIRKLNHNIKADSPLFMFFQHIF
jgi:hypothetical protein